MLTLQHLLSLPEFSDFRIISGFNGVHSPVTSAGFLDWESEADISRSFPPGEFVMTTLVAYRYDPVKAENCVRSLICNGVSAVAVKDVYFSDFSDDLKEFSDKRNIPVMFFHDIFLDDVLFAIKSELMRMNARDNEEAARTLLYTRGLDEGSVLDNVRRFSPFFHGNLISVSFISIAGYDEAMPDLFTRKYNSLGSNVMEKYIDELLMEHTLTENIRHTFIPYRRGLFHILTAMDPSLVPENFEQALLKKFFAIDDSFRIGYSMSSGSLLTVPQAMREALDANILCTTEGMGSCYYGDMEMDRLLCSCASRDELTELFELLDANLRSAGSKEAADDFVATIYSYVSTGGNINAMADELHQHPNTVRYRLSRIQKSWKCPDTMTLKGKAVIYVRLAGFTRLMQLS